MKIILKENIENLGSKGDIVNVAAGYGRNYLLPKKLALEVTSTNMKMIEMEQAALKKNLEKARVTYRDVIQKINDVSLSFERKAGEKDTIFGSVSVSDIKEAMDKLGFEIEKKKILLKEPIKKLGEYSVSIKVFLEDLAEIKIQVIPEGGEKVAVKPEAVTVKADQKTKEKTVDVAPPKDMVEDAPDESQETKKEEIDSVEPKDEAKGKTKTKAKAKTEEEVAVEPEKKEESEKPQELEVKTEETVPEEKKTEAVVEEEVAKEEPVIEAPEKTEKETKPETEKEVIEEKEETETQPEVEAKEEVIEEAASEEAAKEEEKDSGDEKSKTST